MHLWLHDPGQNSRYIAIPRVNTRLACETKRSSLLHRVAPNYAYTVHFTSVGNSEVWVAGTAAHSSDGVGPFVSGLLFQYRGVNVDQKCSREG